MKHSNLRRLLQPRQIAVVGGRMAARVVEQLDKIGFAGEIWPVHPRRATLVGRNCFAHVADLPCAPDATFIAVPREATVETVAQLAKMGGGGAVCYASGFAEIGDAEGVALQKKLQAAMGEMALVGPNCYGVLNYLDGVTLWPDEHGGKKLDRGVAILTQSGNMSISMSMQRRCLPLAYLIATGNMAGVTMTGYVEALLQDERVTAIGLHLEGLEDVGTFSEVALLALKKKVPLVVLKTGQSDLGGQVTMSHTSSLAGSAELYNTFFDRFGIWRTHSIPEFLETLKFLSIVGVLESSEIASISCSGGEAALIADSAERLGLTFSALLPEQKAGLFEVLGEKVALGNPLDYHTYIWGDGAAQTAAFSAMVKGSQAITLKILDFPRADICDPTDWVKTAHAFQHAIQTNHAKGAVVATMPENMLLDIGDELAAHGIAPMLGLDHCLTAIQGAYQIGQKQARANAIHPLRRPRFQNGPVVTLDEAASKRLLAEFGIPVPKSAVTNSADALVVAETVGYPLVVKILSADIVHKSDVGGVVVGVNDSAELQATIQNMSHLGDQFLLEQLAPKPLVEMLLGVTCDPQFGLAIVISAGGILVELLDDSQSLLLPLQRSDVEMALDKLKINKLLQGYRGQPPSDRNSLVAAVMQLASIAETYSRSLHEADINPLFVYENGVLAVDAVIRKTSH